MIAFKRIVVSAVVLCLALAAGIALGAGPLGGDRGDDTATTASDAPSTDSFAEEYAAATAPLLYDRRLAGRSVAVVTTPGVPAATLEDLTARVTAAGATVTTRARLTGELTGAGQKVLVDTLGSQLVEQTPGLATADATTYPRIGQLLGRTLATTAEAPAGVPAEAAGVRQSLEAAHMVRLSPEPAATAPLVLVVLGDDLSDPIATGLVQGLAATARALVVAGSTASGRDGDVAALRELPPDPRVATVDGIETTAGRVSAVLTLVRQVGVAGGAFGASGIDGPAPVG